MLFIDDVEIGGKTLLMRVDYNVPIQDGEITDDNRIRASVPTIQYALDKGAALVLCAHLGRPKDAPDPAFSLAPAAKRLAEILGREVRMAPDCIGPAVKAMVGELMPGEVLMLENLRFHPGEKKSDPEFSRQLAALGQVYVDDAFGVAHRAQASVTGVPQFMDVCCGGLLLKKEWQFLSKVTSDPEHPYVAISGGAKVSGKLEVLQNLLGVVDHLIIGGAMANTFLKAQGYDLKASRVEDEQLDNAKKLLDDAKAKGVQIHLPQDVVVAADPKAEAAAGTYAVDAIPDSMMALDIGPKSVAAFQKALDTAKTVMWNGPMGLFETPAFAEGSLAIARHIGGLSGVTSVVGGGDTDALVHQAGLVDKFSFISTGGGSFLEFLEGKELPAFTALRECANR